MVDLYDANHDFEIATIVANKAVLSATSLSEAKEKSLEAFSITLQKRALNFLKNLEKKIEELSNQDIANLLTILLSSGLSIESEEELEYWISILEAQALHRVLDYLIHASVGYEKNPNSKKKFARNAREFSSKEIEKIDGLLQVVKLAHQKKEPLKKESDEYKKWLEKEKIIKEIETIVKKDIEQKRKEEKQRPQNNNNEKKEAEVDSLGILKDKMLSAGVEANGEYWNDSISSHDTSADKLSFAQNWVASQSRIESEKASSNKNENSSRLDELRGIKKESEQTKSSEKSSDKSSQSNPQSMQSSSIGSMASSGQSR